VIPAFTRRQLLATTGAAGVGLIAGSLGCSTLKSPQAGSTRVTFVTANLVGRVSGYRYELARWGEQHKQTVASTDAAAWGAICREISATGFRAVDIWEAHASPEVMNRERTATWKAILDDYGLKATGYGGALSRQTLEICQWLGIPEINGWIGDHTPEQATALCREMGVRFDIENHPQKTAQEILKVVGGRQRMAGRVHRYRMAGHPGSIRARGHSRVRQFGPLCSYQGCQSRWRSSNLSVG